MRDRAVVVVGGGVAGLVAATELAGEGFRVTLLEAGATVGGKLTADTLDHDGARYTIDCGPTVLTMPWVFEEHFSRAGRALEDFVTIERADVLARHAWRTRGADGGRTFDLRASEAETIDEVGRFFGAKEAANYKQFAREARTIWETVRGPFVLSQRPTPWSALRDLARVGPLAPLQIDGLRTLHAALAARFDDARLVQLFGRYATYCGSSPFLAPGTLALIAHVEREGVGYVVGGMRALAAALTTLATLAGVTIRTGCPARRLELTRGAVSAVVTDGGAIAADAVVFCGDAQALATGLLGDEATRAVVRIEEGERSLSALTYSRVATVEGFPLTRHTVVFSDDEGREFRELFSQRTLPSEPTVYLCAQDRGDGPPATPGPERLFLIVNAPAAGDRAPLSPRELERCEASLRRLLGDAGLSLTIHAETRRTPADFARRYPATGGALYGAASHGPFASFTRPGATTAIEGLFLASGSVHPGAGVPMAALSGRLAATAVKSASPSTRTSRAAATAGSMRTA